MTTIRLAGAIITMGGPDRKIRDEKGKEFTFEDHYYCGPTVLLKNGEFAKNQPGQRASFWNVYQWWSEGGKKIDADGFCIWVAPVPPKMVHMGGRHYKAIYEKK